MTRFLTALILLVSMAASSAFAPHRSAAFRRTVELNANIRGPSEKSKELRFGWDGTTPLGGAVEDAKPARMLDAIRAAGETIPSDCEVFNANVEMSGNDIMFEEVIKLIDTYYEYGLTAFKNGDIVNDAGQNEGSAKILSYAALSKLSKESTLKLWGQYYREVLSNPNGGDHQNIRNFMKYGWEGVPFENGVALTKKKVGDSDWDWHSESWIP